MTLRERLAEMAERWRVRAHRANADGRGPVRCTFDKCIGDLEEVLAVSDDVIDAGPTIVDRVAEAIYRSGAEDRAIANIPERAWRIPESPWDSRDDELCEWERDDYRVMARFAIQAYGRLPEDETAEALRGLVEAVRSCELVRTAIALEKAQAALAAIDRERGGNG